MKILYFDCFSGISGDMTLGALLDIGVGVEEFKNELGKLDIDGYTLKIDKKINNGIHLTHVDVIVYDNQGHEQDHHCNNHGHQHYDDYGHHHDNDHCHNHENDNNQYNHEHHPHNHHHNHDHDHHNHNHDHHNHNHAHCNDDNGTYVYNGDNNNIHPNDHHSHSKERNLRDIENIIDNSKLKTRVKEMSKQIFYEIAKAEAKVHGKSIENIHFHEVGAIDSIVDIVGVAICIDLLNVDRIYSSPIHDGSGFIECQHGTIPVPVPAVMEMLNSSKIPYIVENINTELVTPTGMGIIKCLVQEFGPMPPMYVKGIGYGGGKRNIGRLNALRCMIGESIENEKDDMISKYINTTDNVLSVENYYKQDDICMNEKTDSIDFFEEEVTVLQTNIDDMNPEILGYTMEVLFENGALDVNYTSVYMKKNRPGITITVLCPHSIEKRMAEILFKETTTIGIRKSIMNRYVVRREIKKVTTNYGEVRCKIIYSGKDVKITPEYEDCKKIAMKKNIPLHVVYDTVKKYGEKLS